MVRPSSLLTVPTELANKARADKARAATDREKARRHAGDRQGGGAAGGEHKASRQAEQKAKNQERNARSVLYQAQVKIAQRILDAGDRERAYAVLARHFPEPSQDDIRDTTWHDLWVRFPSELTARDHRKHLYLSVPCSRRQDACHG